MEAFGDTSEDDENGDDDYFCSSYYSTERFGRITIADIEQWELTEAGRQSVNPKMARIDGLPNDDQTKLRRPYTKQDDENETLNRPKYGVEDTRPLVQFVSIGGIQAFTMFDSGCTTQSVSHEFAQAASLDVPIDGIGSVAAWHCWQQECY